MFFGFTYHKESSYGIKDPYVFLKTQCFQFFIHIPTHGYFSVPIVLGNQNSLRFLDLVTPWPWAIPTK